MTAILEKTYLGDSVYAELLDDGMIHLYLDNGLGGYNHIYLEPEVTRAFERFVKRVNEKG